jgi:hypothetical protein
MPEAERTQEVHELDLDSVVVGVEDMNHEQQNADVTTWSRDGLQGESVDATVINQALATAMPEPMYNDLFDEFEDPDDTYIDDGVVPPFISTREGEDSDDDFFV